MQYFILNLVCTDHGKAKLYGKQVRNNLRESCVSGNQELFFSCPLPKTLWKMKEKHLDFRRYSPHSNKLQMSEEGTYYNKNKTKNKNTGKKRKHTSLGLEEGPAGREEQHCPQVVTLAQVGLFHVNPRSGSSARALEDLNRQEDSRPGPSPPLPSPPDERAEGRVWPTPKSPHD